MLQAANMDIFVHGVQTDNEAQLSNFLKGPLSEFGIHRFDLHKPHSKPFAFLTILDTAKAQQFLEKYGSYPRVHARTPLIFEGVRLSLSSSKNLPDNTILRCLALPVAKQRKMSAEKASSGSDRTFAVASMSCGVWDYVDNQLVFVRHFNDPRGGGVQFKAHQAIITLQHGESASSIVLFRYFDVEHAITGTSRNAITGERLYTATFTLKFAPRCYQSGGSGSNDIAVLLARMRVKSQRNNYRRVCGINTAHQRVLATCFVYQIQLSSHRDVSQIHTTLAHCRTLRKSVLDRLITIDLPQEPLRHGFDKLEAKLATGVRDMPFPVRFQLLRLAINGVMSPWRVLDLVPHVEKMLENNNSDAIAEAVRRLGKELAPAGPLTKSQSFSIDQMELSLTTYASDHLAASSAYQIAKKYAHIKLVHKLEVTPAGYVERSIYPSIPRYLVLRVRN